MESHEVQRTAFAIIRTGVCPICEHEIIQCVTTEEARRIGAYQHAQMCTVLKEAGIGP